MMLLTQTTLKSTGGSSMARERIPTVVTSEVHSSSLTDTPTILWYKNCTEWDTRLPLIASLMTTMRTTGLRVQRIYGSKRWLEAETLLRLMAVFLVEKLLVQE